MHGSRSFMHIPQNSEGTRVSFFKVIKSCPNLLRWIWDLHSFTPEPETRAWNRTCCFAEAWITPCLVPRAVIFKGG